MTGTWGAHFFHRWKGYWGTLAAFSQGYRGHEPLPAPHPSLAAPPTAMAAAPARPAMTPREAIQPRYQDSGTVVAAYAPPAAPRPAPASAAQGDESQILDKWRDSGKPLR
jgi:hypothetical protein